MFVRKCGAIRSRSASSVCGVVRCAGQARHLTVVCLGGGAMGSLLAAHLALSPAPLHAHRVALFSGWQPHVNHINREGLTLTDRVTGTSATANGIAATSDFRKLLAWARASDSKQTADGSAADLVFICVKGAEQTRVAARQALALISSHGDAEGGTNYGGTTVGRVVSLQNGPLSHDIIRQVAGERVFYSATTTNGATVTVGHVTQNAHGETFIIDPVDCVEEQREGDKIPLIPEVSHSFPSSPRAPISPLQVAALLTSAGLPSTVRPGQHRDSVLWTKLLANATINPLTALLGVPNGHLLTNPSALELVRLLLAEICEVAQAQKGQSVRDCGNDLFHSSERSARRPDLPSDPLEYVLSVVRTTSLNTSSMLADVQRGRPTEIDVITGTVIQEAERLGLPTPTNRAVMLMVKALEVERRRTE